MAGIEIEVRGLSKHYGETRALNGLDISLRGGEVHALMGENGSGKSTFVKILSGIITPTSGVIEIDGREVHFSDPKSAIVSGIGTIHQDTALVPSLTVAQNLMLGKEPRRGPGVLRGNANEEAVRWLSAVGSEISPDTLAGTLSIAAKQLVAIAKALSNQSRILIFDEPTAALGDAETENLLRLIDELRTQDIAIVYISHRIAEVQRLADRLTVLKDGERTYSGPKLESGDDIVRLMIGREPSDLFPEVKKPGDTYIFEAQGITSFDGKLKPSDFSVRYGEIVGIVGLDGSGRDVLARVVGGVEPIASGGMHFEGKPWQGGSPGKSSKSGITYVPPDRRRQAVIDEFSIAQTMTQSAVWRFATAGVIDVRKELQAAAEARDQMGVKTPQVRNGILTLSGGNQQKAILARSLVSSSKLLVCDEPTAGVDVGARADIYAKFAQLATAGLGVVLSSSDMVELIGMCHRIVVVREGRVVDEFAGDQATEELLLAAQLPTGNTH